MRSITKTLFSLFLILCFIGLAVAPFEISMTKINTHKQYAALSDGESWLSGWSHRKSINLIGQTGAGTDYQILLDIRYGAGTDEGNVFYLDSQCEIDFDDLRFTDNDGATELDYWIEEYSTSVSASVWVEVADSLEEAAQIYLYYGNSLVGTTSNGYETFVEFADFRFFMDTKTWIRGATDERVHLEKLSQVDGVDIPNEQQGLYFDGSNYWVSSSNSTGGAFLYKLGLDGSCIDSVNLTQDMGDYDGNYIRTHTGGIIYRDGYFWVPISDTGSGTPADLDCAGVIARYDKDLTLFDVFLTMENGTLTPDHYAGCSSLVYFDDVIFIPRYGYLSGALDYSYHVYNMTDKSFIGEVYENSDPSISLASDFAYLDRTSTSIDALPMQDMCVYTVRNYQTESVLMVAAPNATGTGLEMWGELKMDGAYGTNGIDVYNGNIYLTYQVTPYPDIYRMNGFVNLTCEIAAINHYIRSSSTIGPNLSMTADILVTGQRKFNFGFAVNWPVSTPEIIAHGSSGYIFLYEGNADSASNLTIASDTWTQLSLYWIDGYAELHNDTDFITLTDDDIPNSAVYAGLQTWGSADAPLYVRKTYVRNWVVDGPHVAEEWQEIAQITLYFNVPFDMWGINTATIFLGLIMIPVSSLYLAHGVKHDRSMDRLFYGLIVFFIGWALLIGGIMS